MSAFIIEEKEFAEMSHKQLLDIFNKHKSISVSVGNKNRIDLCYVSGSKYGIKFTEVISLVHVEKLPSHYTDDPDDERWKTITDVAMNPVTFSRGTKKFKEYYKRLKEGKVMKIKDLTEAEIEEIIREMNKSIGGSE